MLRRGIVAFGFGAALVGVGLDGSSSVPSADQAVAVHTSDLPAPAPPSTPPTSSHGSSTGAGPSTASSANALLSQSIEWQFGGKPQRGWYLYTPLVQGLIGTDADLQSDEFAKAVKRWQRKHRITPANGAIGAAVWEAMFTELQRARSFSTVPPPAAELVEVPGSEWLFQERPAELRQLRRDAYEAYARMVRAARSELGETPSCDFFQLISGYRSREYQEELRLREGGNPSSAALAKNSPHFSGRAIDLYVGGDPVSTKDENRAVQVATPAYRWLVKHAHHYGFRPYFYEPWHWEYDPSLDRKR